MSYKIKAAARVSLVVVICLAALCIATIGVRAVIAAGVETTEVWLSEDDGVATTWDGLTKIWKDGSGNMSFRDDNVTTTTLSTLTSGVLTPYPAVSATQTPVAGDYMRYDSGWQYEATNPWQPLSEPQIFDCYADVYSGLTVNEDGGATANDDFRAETGNDDNALLVDASADQVVVNEDGTPTTSLRVEGDSMAYLLYSDPSDNRIGLNTNSPDYLLDVNGTLGVAGAATLESTLEVKNNVTFKADRSIISHYSADASSAASLRGYRAEGGDIETPTASSSGSWLYEIAGFGYVDDWTNASAQVLFVQDGATTTGDTRVPGRIVFRTTPGGSTAPSERVTIKSDGKVGINEAAPDSTLEVGGTFHATGAATLGSTLDVTGAVDFGSTLDVAGVLTINDYSLPATDGANSYTLVTDGAGQLLWLPYAGGVGGGGGIANIYEAGDVDATMTPAAGDSLVFNGADWSNSALGIEDMADRVATITPAAGDQIFWQGSDWEWATPTPLPGGLEDTTDRYANATPTAGEFVQWTATNGWTWATMDKSDIGSGGTLGFDWPDGDVSDTITVGSAGSVDMAAIQDGGTLSFDWADDEVANDLTISSSGSVDGAALTGTVDADTLQGEAASAFADVSHTHNKSDLASTGTLSFDWPDGDVANDLTISGGTVNNSAIGGSTPSTGAFTTLSASSTISATGAATFNGGVVFNENGADVDFRIESDNLPNGLFYDGTNGYLGIKDGTPSYEVDVAGTIQATNDVIVGDDLTVTDDATVSGGSVLNGGLVVNENSADVDVRIESNTDANAVFLDGANGYVGFGTNGPLYQIDATGTIRAQDDLRAGDDLFVSSDATITDDLSVGDSLSVDSADNTLRVNGTLNAVGIGTGAPEGGFATSGRTSVFNQDSGDYDFRVESNDYTHMVFVDGGSNSVAIGTATASRRFTVYENMGVAGDDYIARFNADGGNDTCRGIEIWCGEDTPTAATNTALGVMDGDGTLVGAITFDNNSIDLSYISDVRMKRDITPTTKTCLSRVGQVPLRSFQKIGAAGRTDGFVADELEAIFPEAVGEIVLTETDYGSGIAAGETVKVVKQGRLVPILWKALQEETAARQALEARVDDLEARLGRLEERGAPTLRTEGAINSQTLEMRIPEWLQNIPADKTPLPVGDLWEIYDGDADVMYIHTNDKIGLAQ